MGFTSFIFTKHTVMRHFSFRKINGLYVSLAPRAKPEGIFRVWGRPSATADKPIIYTIVKTLAKAAMSVPNYPMRMGDRRARSRLFENVDTVVKTCDRG